MRHPLALTVTLALASGALAQSSTPGTQLAPTTPTPTAPATPVQPASTPPTAAPGPTLAQIEVKGTSELLANYVKALLKVQPGAELASLNLRQVEQEVISSGYFKTAVAELSTTSGQAVLNITVTSNPEIAEVEASGMAWIPQNEFKKSLADLLNIAPGATLNTQRIEQAKEGLAQDYRNSGFPFAPSINSVVKPAKDGRVTVSFVVDETAPVSRIEIEGVTLVPAANIANLFKPIYDAKKFTPQAFQAALEGVTQEYQKAGILGANIVPGGLSLEKGLLKLKIAEAKIAEVDVSRLELKDTPGLQSAIGQPLRLSTLQADTRTLANSTGKPVGFNLQPDSQDPARVTVVFGAAEVQGGPVKSIEFVGNTKVPTEQLAAAVKTKVGDSYSPQLAQEDFYSLAKVYQKAGYEVSTRDAISFEDGKLTFKLREVQLAGFKLDWQGSHRTKDQVILRELPKPGGLFNANELRQAIGKVSALGFVTVLDVTIEGDPQAPEKQTYVFHLKEGAGTGFRSFGLGYDTLSGWNGDVGVTFANVGGLGHSAGINLKASRNDVGQVLSGNASYTIPWLDLDFADFKQKRTSLSFGVSSEVSGNSPILDKSSKDTGRDYTLRQTGFWTGLSRNLTPNLSASASTSFGYRQYYLEPLQADEKSTVNDTDAKGLMSKDGFTTTLEGGLQYDNTDNRDFPGRGIRANSRLAYSFGRAGQKPLNWTDLEFGVHGYYGFGDKVVRSFGQETFKNVLAARAHYGTTLGNYPESQAYYIGGSNMLASRELRGLEDGQVFGTNYFTSSVEYRRDLGLSGGISQGIYGILFADYGGAWNKTQAFKGNWGVGVGVQVNLGLGNTSLPTLRFDYGYSPQNSKGTPTQPTKGRFHFRLGTVW